MATGSSITGVKEAVKRLHTVKGETAKGVERGLTKAGQFLLRKSQKIVPVDTGALKASGTIRKTGSGFKTSVDVLYSQSYAIYVHENLEARHKPGKTAKYLERPAREYREAMAAIVRKEAQRKK